MGSGPSPILRRTLIGLTAGIATGVFLGERARVFDPAADGFVRLLQMAVLPYVTTSIIGSIGALQPGELRTLGARAALVLVGLWVVALAFAFLMPLTFPSTESAAFFSPALLEPPPSFDLVGLYIPANPFFALANSIVPAVVLFSMLVGVALTGLPRKQILLEVLETFSAAFARAMRFVVQLTPFGVFAIAATTAGTIDVDQAGRLHVYFIAYSGLSLLVGLWVLPGLVAALTPISMRDLFSSTRDALITAVIAGDLFIVLPLLIQACKDLLARVGPEASRTRSLPDLIAPISFNFPHSGKLLSVSFVLFAGWFSDAVIAPAEYPRLGLTALLTLFGNMSAAMPFLLDHFRVPADAFQLFIAGSVINSRFGTLVAAMHTVTMALLGSCAMTGALQWRTAALRRYLLVTAALTIGVIGGARLAAERIVGAQVVADPLADMRVEPQARAIVRHAAAPIETPPAKGDRLQAVTNRGHLRVGYLVDGLPYAFFNAHGDLVGFDVALLHQLGLELGAELDFRPLAPEALDRPTGAATLLQGGVLDIVIGGMAVTTTRAGLMQLSSTYLDETIGFVVPDGARGGFGTWDAIRAAGPLTIAVPPVPYYTEKVRARLPHARFRTIKTFNEGFGALAPGGGADAFAVPAERASAWTFQHPAYTVVVPAPSSPKIPLAYALPRGEPELASFVNTWIELKRRDGTLDELYRYWILGERVVSTPPRWSIIRDVLHWVE